MLGNQDLELKRVTKVHRSSVVCLVSFIDCFHCSLFLRKRHPLTVTVSGTSWFLRLYRSQRYASTRHGTWVEVQFTNGDTSWIGVCERVLTNSVGNFGSDLVIYCGEKLKGWQQPNLKKVGILSFLFRVLFAAIPDSFGFSVLLSR